MNDYMLQLSDLDRVAMTPVELGRRAARLRGILGLTPDEAASKAGVPIHAYLSFERDGEGTVSTMLAIHRALSRGGLDNLFAAPRFSDIDAYEMHLERGRCS